MLVDNVHGDTNESTTHKLIGIDRIGVYDKMTYCIVCKDLATDRRYSVKVSDIKIDNHLHGFVCRHCYNKFIDSHHNRGFFKVAKLTAWAKSRRDSMRIF